MNDIAKSLLLELNKHEYWRYTENDYFYEYKYGCFHKDIINNYIYDEGYNKNVKKIFINKLVNFIIIAINKKYTSYKNNISIGSCNYSFINKIIDDTVNNYTEKSYFRAEQIIEQKRKQGYYKSNTHYFYKNYFDAFYQEIHYFLNVLQENDNNEFFIFNNFYGGGYYPLYDIPVLYVPPPENTINQFITNINANIFVNPQFTLL